MKIELHVNVKYRTPSLNVTKRQHWTIQQREKRKAWAALLSALRASEFAHSTQTTSLVPSKTYSTACDTLASYLATSHGASSLKPSKPRSPTLTKS